MKKHIVLFAIIFAALGTTLGVKANLGLMFVNLDYSYNLTSGYNAISAGTGIGLR